MNKKDKQEMVGIVTEALNDVMVPALDAMETRLRNDLASKEDLKKVEVKLSMQIDSLDRKFDAQQERLDRHDKRITKLEKKARFVSP